MLAVVFFRLTLDSFLIIMRWQSHESKKKPLVCPNRKHTTFYPPSFQPDGPFNAASQECIVESLQSHFILTMSHWSSGLQLANAVLTGQAKN
jgi:hypothetical protein